MLLPNKMKTAFVTGATGGIGEAVVRVLCENGYKVAIGYCKSVVKAHSLAEANSCVAVFCDQRNADSVNTAVQTVTDLFGGLHLLVNCAGISEWGLFDSMTDETWQNLRSVNLDGVVYACRAVVPVMVRQKCGAIVNIGSVWGETGASCEVAYSACKAGVSGLTKALAKELAPSGITVNCVAPGAVETAMMQRFSQEEITALCEEIPLGRMAKPEEIADAVAFLANAPYVTGQILGVNGGLYI